MFSLVLMLLFTQLGIFGPAAVVVQATALVSSLPANNSGLVVPVALPTNNTNLTSALATLAHQPDNETIASFSKTGTCMSYLGRLLTDYPEDWNRNKSLVSCQNWCSTTDASSDGYGVGPLLTHWKPMITPSLTIQDTDHPLCS